MKKYYLTIPKTARYFTLGDLNKNTESIWFVLHGYGQLAEYFIQKFKLMDDGKTYVIAPEALSKFYLEGFSGRVGATWMTKEERDFEIRDYINYLNLLYTTLLMKYNKEKIKINILGFSQGVPTVCRWIANDAISFDHLYLWAGIFPPDMNRDFRFSVDKLKDKDVTIVYGNKDELLNDEHRKELERYKTEYPFIKVELFEGKHELHEPLLKKFHALR